jgi:hypothetical protein
MSSKKGSAFEREISTLLSRWWTHGEREDVFWRRDSGARAKRRSREGKNTFGAHGDISAIDPIGLPLTTLCTIELKSGYRRWSFLDVLDRPLMRKGQKNRTLQKFEEFMQQVIEDAAAVGNYPVLICKRDKRRRFIVLPRPLYRRIRSYCGKYRGIILAIYNSEYTDHSMYAMDLDSFLDWCGPEFFKEKDKEVKQSGARAKKSKEEEGT